MIDMHLKIRTVQQIHSWIQLVEICIKELNWKFKFGWKLDLSLLRRIDEFRINSGFLKDKLQKYYNSLIYLLVLNFWLGFGRIIKFNLLINNE